MRSDSLFKLTAKQRRVIDRCIGVLVSAKGVEAATRPIRLPFVELVRRQVSVEGRPMLSVILSDAGIEAHDRLVSLLYENAECDGDVLYSDVSRAVRKGVEDCITRGIRPASAEEFLGTLADLLAGTIQDRTFLVALRGARLVGVESIAVGSLTVVNSVDAYISHAGLAAPKSEVKWLWAELRRHPCIVGTFRGSPDAAKKKFATCSHLTSAMLAVAVGYAFDRAATTFGISAQLDGVTELGSSAYLVWDAGGKSVGWGSGGAARQEFEIDAEWAKEMTEPGVLCHAFHILSKTVRSDVEDAIVRAVYWYGDAHRDSVPVMQFVKYWSCLECFFSLGDGEITERLALGVAGVLAFGHLRSVNSSDYLRVKAEVKSLYAKRSKAVHSAAYAHVNQRELVTVSQWAAWVILNMISFANANLEDRAALVDRLTSIDAERRRERAA